MDLDVHKNNDSPFPRAIAMCLKAMVHSTQDMFFQVWRQYANLFRLDTTYYYLLDTNIALISNSEFEWYGGAERSKVACIRDSSG